MYFRMMLMKPFRTSASRCTMWRCWERTSAKDYRPMTESGQLSETFQLDNMFDLLTRRAVRSLADEWTWTNADRNSDIQREILALYDRLIAFL